MKPINFVPNPRIAVLTAGAVMTLLTACGSPDYSGVESAPAEAYSAEAKARGGISDPPAVMPAPVVAEIAPERPTRTRGIPRRGVVTAGDIDDTLNLAAFQRFVARKARALQLPQSNFVSPVTAQLIGSDGKPAPGVRVTLRRPGAADPFWSGYSGVDGNITVFPAVMGAGRQSTVELRAFSENNAEPVTQRLSTGGSRTRISLPFQGEWTPDFLDLAFVVDTTGSMGDELTWLTRELRGIVGAARRSAPGVNIRYGLIVYRDNGDEYVVRNYGFTNSQSQMARWLHDQNASGGGDYPEAAAAALRAGANLPWRRGKGERLMFHIADAPPHNRDARAYLSAARAATMKGVQIFGLGASGVAEESEYLMRQAAAQSNGRYLFLTDDSGVGNSHAEPTISCYRVTRLTNLVTRVLRSELSGHRAEASGGQVLRQVGSYNRGVCRN